jgi:alpha-1,2-mannosyltransferase
MVAPGRGEGSERWKDCAVITERKTVRVLLWVAVALVAAYFLLVAATRDQIDFAVYRAGGAALLHGVDVYRIRVPPIGLPFTYPTTTALLFVPMSWGPVRVIQVIWMSASLVGLWFFVRLTMKRYASGRSAQDLYIHMAVFVLVAVSDPLRVGLALGQINVLLALLVVADFSDILPKIPRGLMIGIGAALKLTPLFLVAYLVVTKKWKQAGVATATFGLLTAIGFIVAPGASNHFWFHGVVTDPSRVGGIGYISNQSVNGLVVRMLGGPAHAKAFWLPIALIVGILVLWTARRAEPQRPWLAEATAMAGMLAVSPISWVHHWIFVLPLLVASLRFARERHSHWLGTTTLLLIGVLMVRMIWWVPNGHNREYHPGFVHLVAGNIDILLLLVILWSLAIMVPRAVPATDHTGRA